MKQRVGDKKHRAVEEATGLQILSCWARGGRSPRYWDCYVVEHEWGGRLGFWYPEQYQWIAGEKRWIEPHMKMSDLEWDWKGEEPLSTSTSGLATSSTREGQAPGIAG